MDRRDGIHVSIGYAGAALRRQPQGRQRAWQSTVGGTLVEVLASTLLISILAAMAYGFARASLVSVRVLDASGEVQELAVLAADILTRELRLAGFSAAGQPLSAVRTAERERVEVATDLNGDGDTNDAHEVIEYVYDAPTQQLMRATSGGSRQPFVSGIAPGGVRFAFHDAAGAELVPGPSGLPIDQRERIRSIGIHLQLELRNPEPRSMAPLTVTFSQEVSLRNAVQTP